MRSGTLAERVAVEGVMLQYAIDVKLDQMLSDCYRVLTEPPMPVNPYPQLLHYIRAYAARLELWKVTLRWWPGDARGDGSAVVLCVGEMPGVLEPLVVPYSC